MGKQARELDEGIFFGEGPRWRDGRLWFSDFYASAVKSVSLAGDVRIEFTNDPVVVRRNSCRLVIDTTSSEPSGSQPRPEGRSSMVNCRQTATRTAHTFPLKQSTRWTCLGDGRRSRCAEASLSLGIVPSRTRRTSSGRSGVSMRLPKDRWRRVI